MKRLKIAYSDKALEIFGAIPSRETVNVNDTDFTDVGAVAMQIQTTASRAHLQKIEPRLVADEERLAVFYDYEIHPNPRLRIQPSRIPMFKVSSRLKNGVLDRTILRTELSSRATKRIYST